MNIEVTNVHIRGIVDALRNNVSATKALNQQDWATITRASGTKGRKDQLKNSRDAEAQGTA